MDAKRTALLVVDVQLGAFDGVRTAPMQHGDALLTAARTLIETAREQSVPIVYVQHRGEAGDAFEADSPHFVVHPALDPRAGDLFVHKKEGSAFVGTPLGAWLAERDIECVIVCGLQSEHCITATTTSAIELGYETLLAGDGHGTWDFAGEAARSISDRQNALLASRGATVLPVAAIVQQLSRPMHG